MNVIIALGVMLYCGWVNYSTGWLGYPVVMYPEHMLESLRSQFENIKVALLLLEA